MMRPHLPLLMLSATLAACSNVELNPAPVVSQTSVPASLAAQGVETAPIGPNAAHAGEPGYYMVQRGDTLRRVAQKYGRSWHDLVAWNTLSNPDRIEVGEVLRVDPPAGAGAAAAAAAPAGKGEQQVAQAFPLAPASTMSASAPASAPASAARPAQAQVPAPPASRAAPKAPGVRTASAPVATAKSEAAPVAATALHWAWPVSGKVIQGFNGGTSKGLDLAGQRGEAVHAAAAGKVVYAGNELRGFGNLVIVKHSSEYISVYAHNDKLLVKDGQEVKGGQQIALMGSSDAPRVELHFEVRLRGKPIDPMQVLPAR